MSPEGIQSDGRIPGSSVHRYLDEYATKFDLQRRIRLGCTVKSTEWNHELKTWSLGLVGSDETLSCDKVIVATGLTSKPSLPAVPHDTYHGEILHAKSLGHPNFVQKIQDPTVERVLVYGGSKSAFDTVHMLLQMGKQIDWVIRPGNGPSVMSPLSIFGTRTFRLSNTRFMGLFSPTAYDLDSRWHKAVHGPNSTNIARSGVKYFWKVMAYLTMRPAQYEISENGRRLFPQLGLMRYVLMRSPPSLLLMVSCSLFWSSATLGVMTHPELWNEIHRNSLITVSRKEIRNMSQDTVHFTDGSHHRTDMVILATGWQADHSIFAGGDGAASSGISSQPHDTETENRWTMLEQTAEREIIMKLPLLQETPTIAGKTQSSPSNILYRLYRHIVPIMDPRDIPSIAFVGMLRTTGAPLVFEAQALWAVAYLTGKIKSPPEQEMRSHTALINAWIKRRYLCGLKVPFALFDFMSVSSPSCCTSAVKITNDKPVYRRPLSGSWGEQSPKG